MIGIDFDEEGITFHFHGWPEWLLVAVFIAGLGFIVYCAILAIAVVFDIGLGLV